MKLITENAITVIALLFSVEKKENPKNEKVMPLKNKSKRKCLPNLSDNFADNDPPMIPASDALPTINPITVSVRCVLTERKIAKNGKLMYVAALVIPVPTRS